ncbi:MAG: nucleotide sugar dehydrogenase [Xanthobacteraceae bacterium]
MNFVSVSKLDAEASRLLSSFEDKTARIGVIGLGYVGIPLAMTAVEYGFRVTGFDIDTDRVAQINRGESFIKHISSKALSTVVESKRLNATTDFEQLAEQDAILIAVPTPLTKQREPDLTFVVNSTQQIAKRLRKNQLVVLESTTYPGTTREVMKPILEATGLKSGTDFYLAFSPEREDPGNPDFNTRLIPKIVGGDGETASALVKALYSQIVDRVVPVSSPETAEAVKLTENIFRAVNIALANELKVIYGAMGIDVWEVIEGAKTKPFGFMPFYPGPGLGGHCIPIDPFYLTWKAREYDIATRFIELAGQINASMPYLVVTKLAEALDRRLGRGLNGAKVLLMGMAYKKNVDDMRESPSLKLIELIEGRGAHVDYHDPFIPVIPPTREHAVLSGRRSITLSPQTVAGYDAVLISTDHDTVDYGLVVEHAKLVVDTRNVCARTGVFRNTIVKA